MAFSINAGKRSAACGHFEKWNFIFQKIGSVDSKWSNLKTPGSYIPSPHSLLMSDMQCPFPCMQEKWNAASEKKEICLCNNMFRGLQPNGPTFKHQGVIHPSSHSPYSHYFARTCFPRSLVPFFLHRIIQRKVIVCFTKPSISVTVSLFFTQLESRLTPSTVKSRVESTTILLPLI